MARAKQPKRSARLELAEGSRMRLYVRLDESSEETYERELREVRARLRWWAGELEKVADAKKAKAA